MNLTNIATLKRLCKELNIWPSKKLGQNFLINNNILDKIIKAGGLSAQDNVIEIGPGFGVLTMELLKYIKNLIIIEKDKKLAEFLEKEIDGRIKIIINDILKISNFQFPISKQIPNSKFQIPNGKVIAIEVIPELKEFGEKNVAKYNFVKKGTVEFICADGYKGLEEEMPFDKILVSATASEIPLAWKKQLKIGGRIVVPIGQSIFVVEKIDKTQFSEREYFGFSFVPLVKGK